MLEEFRRADCAIQSVDIGGLRARRPEVQRAGGRDSLFMMADGTGGELYENFNDLSAAMGQMLERTGVTYVLAFQPERSGADGAYHPLRVELRNAAAGRAGGPPPRLLRAEAVRRAEPDSSGCSRPASW